MYLNFLPELVQFCIVKISKVWAHDNPRTNRTIKHDNVDIFVEI